MNIKTLEKALDGDDKAFSKIYSTYFDGLWRYVFSRIKLAETAKDIVSESFIALYENIKNVKHPKAIKSYLYKIAINKMKKFFAKEKTLALSEFQLDRVEIDQPSNPDPEKIKKLEVQVEGILDKLPENYAQILRLRFLSNLKIREVAEITDNSESNVKVLQHRALKKARKILDINKKNK